MFRQSVMFTSPISDAEEAPPQSPPPVSLSERMAASAPLRSFPLSDLKWAMNHSNSHRLRKSSGNAPLRRAGNSVVEETNGVSGEKKKGIPTVGCNLSADRSEKKSTTADIRSKVLIRIRPKSSDDASASGIDEDVSIGDRISDGAHEHELEEFAPKTWNLRPRKPSPKKRPTGIGGGLLKSCSGSALETKLQGTTRSDSTRSRSSADAKIATDRKEKKQKFSISLSKMEIDEDIFAWSGSKPSRRPKKRAKNVQKLLDVLFPGLWMGNVTPDAYKASNHA